MQGHNPLGGDPFDDDGDPLGHIATLAPLAPAPVTKQNSPTLGIATEAAEAAISALAAVNPALGLLAQLDLKANQIEETCKQPLGTTKPKAQSTKQPATRKSARVKEKAAAVVTPDDDEAETPETNDADEASLSDESDFDPENLEESAEGDSD